MEELSVEQKAKAYDKAIERARRYYDEYKTRNNILYVEDMEDMFPELKESEDEEIRKSIIAILNNYVDNSNTFKPKMIAWLEKQGKTFTKKDVDDAYLKGISNTKNELEKQGEQKPADKVEPKFKVGDEIKTANKESLTITKIDEKGYWSEDLFICGFDEECIWDLVGQKHTDKPKFHKGEWIVHQGTDNIYQVVAVIDNQYQLKYGDNYTVQKCADVDRCARLWDITKDANVGDVLVHNGCTFIFMGIKNSIVKAICTELRDTILNFSESEYDNDYCPATKEQCDLLFQKMKEAGYEWDAEKKELKKIEHPEFSKDNLSDFESYLCLMFQKFRTKGICTNGEIIDFVKEHSQKLKDTLCHVWSEEDEGFLNLLLAIFTNEHPNGIFSTGNIPGFKGDCITSKRIIAWLKSLKDRVQPKQEWSEEDEKVLHAIRNALNYEKPRNYLKSRDFEFTDILDWLKSLRPQNTWKPSDEHYELEEFAKIVRSNLTGISKVVQELFEAKYLQLTGNKMYVGFKD